METIKLIFLNYSFGFIALGVAIIVIVNAFTSEIKNHYKYILIPIFILLFLLSAYKTVDAIYQSKSALYEKDIFSDAFKNWRNEKPAEADLYLELKYRFRNNVCLICRDRATYGVVSYQTGNDPSKRSPGKLLVCSEHTHFLSLYISHNDSVRQNFRANHLNNNKFSDSIITRNIDDKTLYGIMSATIDNHDIDLRNLKAGIPDSKEMILSNAGRYFYILLGFAIIFAFIDRD
jgi:hypothetical protein